MLKPETRVVKHDAQLCARSSAALVEDSSRTPGSGASQTVAPPRCEIVQGPDAYYTIRSLKYVCIYIYIYVHTYIHTYIHIKQHLRVTARRDVRVHGLHGCAGATHGLHPQESIAVFASAVSGSKTCCYLTYSSSTYCLWLISFHEFQRGFPPPSFCRHGFHAPER